MFSIRKVVTLGAKEDIVRDFSGKSITGEVWLVTVSSRLAALMSCAGRTLSRGS